MPRFNTFSINVSTINLKSFPNHGRIYRFARKFNKHSEERQSPKQFIEIEIWEDASLRLILKTKGVNRYYVYHFVDRDREDELS